MSRLSSLTRKKYSTCLFGSRSFYYAPQDNGWKKLQTRKMTKKVRNYYTGRTEKSRRRKKNRSRDLRRVCFDNKSETIF